MSAVVELPAMMKAPEVAKQLGVCERSLQNLVDRGEFPKPVRLGRSVRWPRIVFDEWVAKAAEAVG